MRRYYTANIYDIYPSDTCVYTYDIYTQTHSDGVQRMRRTCHFTFERERDNDRRECTTINTSHKAGSVLVCAALLPLNHA